MTRPLAQSSALADQAVPERHDRPKRRRLDRWLSTLASIVVFFASWEAVLRILDVESFLLPRPLEVLEALRISIDRRPTGRGTTGSSGWS